MLTRRQTILSSFLFPFATSATASPPFSRKCNVLGGVNLATGGFAPHKLPGKVGVDYAYPTNKEVEYFYQRKMRLFRIPVLWERLQPKIGGNLRESEMQKLDELIEYISALPGAKFIFDPHNYGKYYGSPLSTSGDITGSELGGFLAKVAQRWKMHASSLHIGLMNEPHVQDAATWRQIAMDAVRKLRDSGWEKTILVPGTAFTNGHLWHSRGNADAWEGYLDKDREITFEIHQYLTASGSGNSDDAVVGSGSTRLAWVTTWAREKKRKLFLGEFGASVNIGMQTEITRLLDFINVNADVWSGWTYWAAGEMWNPSYRYSIQPRKEEGDSALERPQLQYLRPFLHPC